MRIVENPNFNMNAKAKAFKGKIKLEKINTESNNQTSKESDNIIKYGKEHVTRFPRVRERLYNDLLKQFGPVANFINTGERYVEPLPTLPDLSKVENEDMKEELLSVHREARKIVQKTNLDYRKDLFKIFSIVMDRLSPESLAKEKAHPHHHNVVNLRQ